MSLNTVWKRLTAMLLISSLLLTAGCGMQIVRLPEEQDVPVISAPYETKKPDSEPEQKMPENDGEAADDTQADPSAAEYDRPGVGFEDFSYERPDYNEIHEHILQIYDLMQHGAKDSEVSEAYEELNDMLDWVDTQYNLMMLVSSMNADNEACQNELSEVVEIYDRLTTEQVNLQSAIMDSRYREMVFEGWTDEDFEHYNTASRLYDDAYIELDSRINEITLEYQEAMVSATVSYQGRELTLSDIYDLSGITEETYYSLLNSYYKKLNDIAAPLYVEFVGLQNQLAEKAGYDNYAEFAYDYVYERDYSTEDAAALWQYVKEYIVPVCESVGNSISYSEYAALTMLNSGSGYLTRMLQNMKNYAAEISPDMAEAMQFLIDYDLSILTDDDGSEDGAYTTYLYSYDVPFIYLHESGGFDDLFTFIHEFGHFYSFYLGGADAADYMPLDIAEICSQANEMLFMKKLREVSSQLQYSAILKNQLYYYLQTLVDGCLYDEFQQYVYTHEPATVEELNSVFVELAAEYGMRSEDCAVDIGYFWVMVQHNFTAPMYYISYAAALIPSLEIFKLDHEDREAAIAVYDRIVRSDEGDFRSILEDCGLSDPFEEETIRAIADMCLEAAGVRAPVG